MAKKTSRLRRAQLDRAFNESLRGLSLGRPKSGWIREIREALGMSMADLALRLGVIKQRIERIEKDEIAGRLTIETLAKAAEALNCEFIYFLRPKESLQATVKKQAFKTARAIAANVETSMKLEDQGTSIKAQNDLIESLAEELLAKGDRRIWSAN